MGRAEKRRCLNCGEAFTPPPRSAQRQQYCGLAPCKVASKRASQAKWLAKPENRDYHCGPEALARVGAWRAAHPGYSRHPETVAPAEVARPMSAPPTVPEPAPEPLPTVVAPDPQISCNASRSPLQDILSAQPVVLVGFIAHLTGSALQDDIASVLSRLVQLGLDIRGGRHEYRQAGS